MGEGLVIRRGKQIPLRCAVRNDKGEGARFRNDNGKGRGFGMARVGGAVRNDRGGVGSEWPGFQQIPPFGRNDKTKQIPPFGRNDKTKLSE